MGLESAHRLVGVGAGLDWSHRHGLVTLIDHLLLHAVDAVAKVERHAADGVDDVAVVAVQMLAIELRHGLDGLVLNLGSHIGDAPGRGSVGEVAARSDLDSVQGFEPNSGRVGLRGIRTLKLGLLNAGSQRLACDIGLQGGGLTEVAGRGRLVARLSRHRGRG